MKTIFFIFLLTAVNEVYGNDLAVEIATTPMPGDDTHIELEDLLQTAVSHNPELKAARATIISEKAKLSPAGTLEDPVFTAEVMSLPTDSFKLNQSEMSGIRIGLSQKFPFPGKLERQQNITRKQILAAESRLKQIELSLFRDIKKVYYNLYLSGKKKKIINSQRALLQQILVTSRNQYALNKLPQAAILNLQVEDARLLDDELRLTTEIKEQQLTLAHLVGTHGSLDVLPNSIEHSPIDLSKFKDEQIADVVLKNSPAVQLFAVELETSEVKVSLVERSYYPDFEVMINYTFRQPINDPMVGKSTVPDLVGAGIGFSIPIWAGQKQGEEVRSAVADKEAALSELQNAKLAITHEALIIFEKLKESRRRIDLFKNGLLQLSKQAVTSGMASYLAGTLDNASLINSIRTQQSAEFSYHEALIEFEIQLANLEAITGKI